jgi:hypothetical protein
LKTQWAVTVCSCDSLPKSSACGRQKSPSEYSCLTWHAYHFATSDKKKSNAGPNFQAQFSIISFKKLRRLQKLFVTAGTSLPSCYPAGEHECKSFSVIACRTTRNNGKRHATERQQIGIFYAVHADGCIRNNGTCHATATRKQQQRDGIFCAEDLISSVRYLARSWSVGW